MQLYYFSSDRGVTESVFAANQERATELFVEVLIMSGAPPANFWSRTLEVDASVEPHRSRLREALARDVEGFGEYHDQSGWRIISLAERIRQL